MTWALIIGMLAFVALTWVVALCLDAPVIPKH
jgi:hypothetical protein